MADKHVEKVMNVLGLVIIAAVLAGCVVGYIYFGWCAVAGVALLMGYAVLEGSVTSLPGRLDQRKLARRRELGHCIKCGYDLTGNPDATACPECGTNVGSDEQDKDSFF